MKHILEMLQTKQNRDSTNSNYLGIWRQLNNFLLRLDVMRKFWEDRVALFCAYLVEERNVQSATLRSYVSVIKFTLRCDNYKWQDERVWLQALFKSCRKLNDVHSPRFPIHFSLLELILFEVDRLYDQQLYLSVLFKTIFALAYYGLIRIGEISDSRHAIRACNIQLAQNKDKIKILLYSSKMHDKESKPQQIKISAAEKVSIKKKDRFFCPFLLMRQYMKLRGGYLSDDESFFLYSDKSVIPQNTIRNCLKKIITKLNLNSNVYMFQSLRTGRATDMLKFGYPIEMIKRCGRWKSNTVYRYLKPS